ncbi:MAG: hypothetical protein IPJ46_06455 [Anaerolineales bacterium]|nr:hypothetical protein [Anaerolineales bacterium]
MPVNIIKKPEWGLLYYHFQGYCTSAETISAAQEIASEALGGKIESEGKAMTIFDFLEGVLDIEQKDVRQILAMNKQLFESGKSPPMRLFLPKPNPGNICESGLN